MSDASRHLLAIAQAGNPAGAIGGTNRIYPFKSCKLRAIRHIRRLADTPPSVAGPQPLRFGSTSCTAGSIWCTVGSPGSSSSSTRFGPTRT